MSEATAGTQATLDGAAGAAAVEQAAVRRQTMYVVFESPDDGRTLIRKGSVEAENRKAALREFYSGNKAKDVSAGKTYFAIPEASCAGARLTPKTGFTVSDIDDPA